MIMAPLHFIIGWWRIHTPNSSFRLIPRMIDRTGWETSARVDAVFESRKHGYVHRSIRRRFPASGRRSVCLLEESICIGMHFWHREQIHLINNNIQTSYTVQRLTWSFHRNQHCQQNICFCRKINNWYEYIINIGLAKNSYRFLLLDGIRRA